MEDRNYRVPRKVLLYKVASLPFVATLPHDIYCTFTYAIINCSDIYFCYRSLYTIHILRFILFYLFYPLSDPFAGTKNFVTYKYIHEKQNTFLCRYCKVPLPNPFSIVQIFYNNPVLSKLCQNPLHCTVLLKVR
jgi:hypothetical protein